MSRKAKGPGFSLKSGNKTNYKNMGSSLPGISTSGYSNQPDGRAKSSAFQKDWKSYQATLQAVTADMTDQELRDMAVAQHGGKASKWNVGFNDLKKQRRSLIDNPPIEEIEQETKSGVRPTLPSEEPTEPEGWQLGIGSTTIGSGKAFEETLTAEQLQEQKIRESKVFKGL